MSKYHISYIFQTQTYRCCCFCIHYFVFFPPKFLHVMIYARVLKLSDTTKLALEMKPETILGKLNYSFRREMESNQ